MSQTVTMQQLRCFVAVAEELHFGRAAQRLSVAQPAVSQQIRALEAAVGCALVIRRPRVMLTASGKTLNNEAQQLLQRLDRGIAATRSAAHKDAGPLRIGFAASAILTHVPAMIAQFRRRFPTIAMDLKELSPREELDAVASGAVDVAFVREIQPHRDLRYDIVIREAFGVIFPARHALSASATVRPEALAGESFVHFPRDVAPALFDQINAVCRGAGFSPRVVQEAREWLTEISLVQAGVGIAIVPASLRHLKLGGVGYRALGGNVTGAPIALCRGRGVLAPATRAFVRMAKLPAR